VPLPDLQGRTVVITGASRGLGAGMAQEMARLGLRLGLCARRAPALPDGLAAADGVTQALDVRDAGAVHGFAAEVTRRLGRIDLWVNNAGVLDPIAFVRDLEPDALREHLEVNVLGVLHGSQAYVRHVRAHGQGGVLVNVSSGAAQKGYAAWGAYCASKAAVDRLSECVALEEAEVGLRAYAVAPGVIDTAMQERIRSLTPEEFPMVEKFHQLKRDEAFNSPEYVARQLLSVAFDPSACPDEVVVRLPPERA